MSAFQNPSGQIQQLPLDVTMYRAAAEAGQSFQEYVNRTYPTDPSRYGTTFQQLCASEGIYLRGDRELGIRPSTMQAMFDGAVEQKAGVITKDGVPQSRILAPAVIMGAIEDRLQQNFTMTPAAFDQLVGYDETIDRDRYEQPVMNFDKPSEGRSQVISQGVEPATMMTLSLSEKSYKIPTFSLGLTVTDEAVKALKIDFVALSLARQAMVQRNERAQGYLLALLNGDVDNGDGSLASKGYSVNASALDAAAGAALTQKAWIKYLMRNGTKRQIQWIIADIDSAMAVEARAGRPTVQTDDPTSNRIDTTFDIANPTWPTRVKLFLTQDSNWPALTMMGLDPRFAIRRVRNLSADYAAIESYVMKREKAMRFDFAEHVNRMFDEAFDVLVRA